MTEFGNKPALFSLPLFRDDPHPCSYLPGRTAQNQVAFADQLAPDIYRQLMDRGFRRSGRIVYRPMCSGCRECIPLRVPVSSFQPSRSQRRVWQRNHDLRIEIAPPKQSDEKFEVYQAYLAHQHDGSMSEDRESFHRFLYDSPTDTLEFTYYAGDEVVGVGICDICPSIISSVYFYYHPEFARRSPGVFSALYEIEECRRRGLQYWYAGYFIRESRKMNYKSAFRPFELLDENGIWQPA